MKILIADDHQLFIDGIRHILARLDPDVRVTEVNSAERAIETLESDPSFDLILVDLGLPGMDGTSIIQRMRARGTCLPLVVISGEQDARVIQSVLEAGALGFIPKSHNSQQMLAALEQVLDGEIYLPVDIEQQIRRLETRRNSTSELVTKRQLDVLRLMAKGYSNKQIAASLFLTEHTIKTHVSAIFMALDACNRTECVRIAQREGLLQA